jgi:hypothetical protein
MNPYRAINPHNYSNNDSSTRNPPIIRRKPVQAAEQKSRDVTLANPSALRRQRTDASLFRKVGEQPDLSTLNLVQHQRPKRLTKPPRIHVHIQHRPLSRKRLNQRAGNTLAKPGSHRHPYSTLFLLQYHQYPYDISPGTLLGVFASIHTVTAAAISHGAYAFSRDGMRDGSEYLTANGRIRIAPYHVQHHGVQATLPQRHTRHAVPERTPAIDRRTIARTYEKNDGRRPVFLALELSSAALICMGLFTERKRAWGVCLKQKALCEREVPLQNEVQWADQDDLPHARARVQGRGWHEWRVEAFVVDEMRARR